MADWTIGGRTNILQLPTITSDGSITIVCHGGYGTPASIQARLKLEEFNPASCVVYVAGVSGFWAVLTSPRDVGYIQFLLSTLFYTYPTQLSRDKVDFVGHSMGAMMGFKFANNYPLRSLVSIAGTYLEPVPLAGKVKVWSLHGEDDLVVPIEGTEYYPSISKTKDGCGSLVKPAKFTILKSCGHSLIDFKQAMPTLQRDIMDFPTV